MRILTVTGIFPSRSSPSQGVFVLERTRAIRDLGVEVRVLAPVPWVPPGPLPNRYKAARATPREEEIERITVRHPRYLMVPKVGTYWQDSAYARGIAAAVRDEIVRFRPDLLDVHYLYPDACGVARLAGAAGIPYVCSARGSDVKEIGKTPTFARRIRAALRGAAAVVAVSRDLADSMRELGLHDGEIRVIPNGIDPAKFFARERTAARAALGLPLQGRIVVCVGHIAPVHGQDLVLEAMRRPEMPADVVAYLVGGGDGLEVLRDRVASLGLGDRVFLPGPVPHAEVPLWFSAADASLHPGSRAGCPNAVLESLACGTPCLASDLPEMREVLDSESRGLLVAREPGAIAAGIAALLARAQGDGVRPESPRTWAEVAAEVIALFEEVRRRGARTNPTGSRPPARSGGATG